MQQETTVKVLLEVNISGDEAKTGFLSRELEPVQAKPKEESRLRLDGDGGVGD